MADYLIPLTQVWKTFNFLYFSLSQFNFVLGFYSLGDQNLNLSQFQVFPHRIYLNSVRLAYDGSHRTWVWWHLVLGCLCMPTSAETCIAHVYIVHGHGFMKIWRPLLAPSPAPTPAPAVPPGPLDVSAALRREDYSTMLRSGDNLTSFAAPRFGYTSQQFSALPALCQGTVKTGGGGCWGHLQASMWEANACLFLFDLPNKIARVVQGVLLPSWDSAFNGSFPSGARTECQLPFQCPLFPSQEIGEFLFLTSFQMAGPRHLKLKSQAFST